MPPWLLQVHRPPYPKSTRMPFVGTARRRTWWRMVSRPAHVRDRALLTCRTDQDASHRTGPFPAAPPGRVRRRPAHLGVLILPTSWRPIMSVRLNSSISTVPRLASQRTGSEKARHLHRLPRCQAFSQAMPSCALPHGIVPHRVPLSRPQRDASGPFRSIIAC